MILEANQITSLGQRCQDIFTRHIDAWDSRDSESLRSVYTDDIVHFDGEPAFIGIDDVAGMADDMFDWFPDWQMKVGDTFISKDQCLGTWINWDLLGLTMDYPGVEYDLMDIREDKISYWQAFYDKRFINVFGVPRINQDFLSQFASSWSGGDADELVKSYSEDAKLEDSLFGETITGTPAIHDYANRFFARSPGAYWTLLFPFAEEKSVNMPDQYPYPAQGGVFTITVKDVAGNPCEIHAAVIMNPNEEKIITSQKILYDADTLLACGWAR